MASNTLERTTSWNSTKDDDFGMDWDGDLLRVDLEHSLMEVSAMLQGGGLMDPGAIAAAVAEGEMTPVATTHHHHHHPHHAHQQEQHQAPSAPKSYMAMAAPSQPLARLSSKENSQRSKKTSATGASATTTTTSYPFTPSSHHHQDENAEQQQPIAMDTSGSISSCTTTATSISSCSSKKSHAGSTGGATPSSSGTPLPRINVRLLPQNSATAARIRDAGYNPKLELSTPLNKRVSFFVDHLTSRWAHVPGIGSLSLRLAASPGQRLDGKVRLHSLAHLADSDAGASSSSSGKKNGGSKKKDRSSGGSSGSSGMNTPHTGAGAGVGADTPPLTPSSFLKLHYVLRQEVNLTTHTSTHTYTHTQQHQQQQQPRLGSAAGQDFASSSSTSMSVTAAARAEAGGGGWLHEENSLFDAFAASGLDNLPTEVITEAADFHRHMASAAAVADGAVAPEVAAVAVAPAAAALQHEEEQEPAPILPTSSFSSISSSSSSSSTSSQRQQHKDKPRRKRVPLTTGDASNRNDTFINAATICTPAMPKRHTSSSSSTSFSSSSSSFESSGEGSITHSHSTSTHTHTQQQPKQPGSDKKRRRIRPTLLPAGEVVAASPGFLQAQCGLGSFTSESSRQSSFSNSGEYSQ